jgi:hypothetical protein
MREALEVPLVRPEEDLTPLYDFGSVLIRSVADRYLTFHILGHKVEMVMLLAEPLKLANKKIPSCGVEPDL